MYYVIQVQTGKEESTIEEIKRRFKSSLVFDVFIPKTVLRKKYLGEWHDVEKPSFPGYIFISTDDIKTVFKLLYFVPSFTKLLGRERGTENFLPLNEVESRMIDILYKKDSDYIASISKIKFEEGQKIIVLDGPLAGQEAYISKLNLHKRLATIDLKICGVTMSVDLGIDIISILN